MKIRKQDAGLVGELAKRSEQLENERQSKNAVNNHRAVKDSDIKINISTAKAVRDLVGSNNQEKIAKIRDAVENGSYKISSDKIADSLFRHVKEESFFAKAEGGEGFGSDADLGGNGQQQIAKK